MKEAFTTQLLHSHSPIWEFCPDLFSLNIGNFLSTYPNISMSRAAKGVKIMFRQREQQHRKQWPKATALRACPNPLNTSGGGFFLKKGKLQATVHLQIHRYRQTYIMIMSKSSFIFVLSVYPVSITLPTCHDGATEKSCEGDASPHTDSSLKSTGHRFSCLFCKMSHSWPVSTAFIYHNIPTPSSSQVC